MEDRIHSQETIICIFFCDSPQSKQFSTPVTFLDPTTFKPIFLTVTVPLLDFAPRLDDVKGLKIIHFNSSLVPLKAANRSTQ